MACDFVTGNFFFREPPFFHSLVSHNGIVGEMGLGLAMQHYISLL